MSTLLTPTIFAASPDLEHDVVVFAVLVLGAFGVVRSVVIIAAIVGLEIGHLIDLAKKTLPPEVAIHLTKSIKRIMRQAAKARADRAGPGATTKASAPRTQPTPRRPRR